MQLRKSIMQQIKNSITWGHQRFKKAFNTMNHDILKKVVGQVWNFLEQLSEEAVWIQKAALSEHFGCPSTVRPQPSSLGWQFRISTSCGISEHDSGSDSEHVLGSNLSGCTLEPELPGCVPEPKSAESVFESKSLEPFFECKSAEPTSESKSSGCIPEPEARKGVYDPGTPVHSSDPGTTVCSSDHRTLVWR